MKIEFLVWEQVVYLKVVLFLGLTTFKRAVYSVQQCSSPVNNKFVVREKSFDIQLGITVSYLYPTPNFIHTLISFTFFCSSAHAYFHFITSC